MSLNIDFSSVSESEQNSNKTSGLNLSLESVDNNDNDNNNVNIDSSSLALNLEDIAELEESQEILEDFNIDDDEISRLVAAIGAGIATESVINARILSAYDTIEEARALKKMVVRNGKLVSKKICPEGFKVQKNGTCIRMSSRDVIAYKRRAKKASKTRSRRKPTTSSARSRKRSLMVRQRNQAKVNRVTPV